MGENFIFFASRWNLGTDGVSAVIAIIIPDLLTGVVIDTDPEIVKDYRNFVYSTQGTDKIVYSFRLGGTIVGNTGANTIFAGRTRRRCTQVTGIFRKTVSIVVTIGYSPGLTSLRVDTCPAFVLVGQNFMFEALWFCKR
jgi:hypothetical protein